MRYLIKDDYHDDTFIVKGETADECRELAYKIIEQKGWNKFDAYSTILPDEEYSNVTISI